MRRTITRLVASYKKKAGITIPVDVRFVRRHMHPPAVTHITLDTHSGKATHAVISIDPVHFERTAQKSEKSTDIYLKYAIAHEIAHIRNVERLGYKSFRVSKKKLESYADRKAFDITKHGGRQTQHAIDALQRRFKTK